MKKAILFLFLMLSIDAYADNDPEVKLVYGDVSSIVSTGEMLIEFNFENTYVEHKPLNEYLKSRGDDFVRDFPEETEFSNLYFTANFNKKNDSGIKLVETSSSAKYKMIVYVDSLDMGNGGSTFVPFASNKAGGVIMWGYIAIIEIATGNEALEISFDNIKGQSHVAEKIRRGLANLELQKRLIKLLEKGGTGTGTPRYEK